MKVKLGIFALIATISCGATWAQSNPFAGQTPVNTVLKKPFSSRDKAGAEISVTTDQDVTIGTTKLPKGSILLGHIVDATKHSKDDPDSLIIIVFETATPKKGAPIPITASVLKLTPADDNGEPVAGIQFKNPVINEVLDTNGKVVKGMISATSAPIPVMSSIPTIAIGTETSKGKSGVFGAKNADVELQAGMHLILGVAPDTK
jgi:hypothetical protein